MFILKSSGKYFSALLTGNGDVMENIDAIEGFIGTDEFENISSGKFHDAWFNYLEDNQFIFSKLAGVLYQGV